MSVEHVRVMVCNGVWPPSGDPCSERVPEADWEFHMSLPFAVDASAWFHDGDVSFCPVHAAEELALRERAAVVGPSAADLADWTHPRTSR